MDNKTTQKYLAKSNDSFKTKLNLYLFSKAIQQDWNNITLEDFMSFEISADLVELYTTQDWQYEPSYILRPGLTNDIVYKQIDKKEKEYKSLIEAFRADYIAHFPVVFTPSNFETFVAKKECAYCGISIDEIEQLANLHQLRITEDGLWRLTGLIPI